MRRSLSIGGSSSVQWRKVGRSWRLRMCFRRLLCVRIKIDQHHCVNCWVIMHCLSVSCAKINHSRCALVIWSSLQLTSKQWIITQQFTAGADIFLKLSSNQPAQLQRLARFFEILHVSNLAIMLSGDFNLKLWEFTLLFALFLDLHCYLLSFWRANNNVYSQSFRLNNSVDLRTFFNNDKNARVYGLICAFVVRMQQNQVLVAFLFIK